MENRYRFREALTVSNRPFAYTLRAKTDHELSLLSGITFQGDDSAVIAHAKADLCDYLKVCFGVTENGVSPVPVSIRITEQELGDMAAYKGRVVTVGSDGIEIHAFDERGAAQAIYDLEDRMTVKKQPFLDIGQTRNKPLFAPRMVHSAYGMDQYPEGYLQVLAKEGIDAIMLTLKGVNEVVSGARDINAIIALAAEYGIDTYAYWDRPLYHSPEAEDAEAVYSAAFGEVFRAHPGFKGVILVGESVQFPSKDPRTTGKPYWETFDEDGFQDMRPGPSHWPCCDYPVWLDLVKRVIRCEKPDADIVFWTYNWGCAPEEARIALIDSLPTDISLMVTFEMFENLPTEYGITERVCDYSVAFAGPGGYFLSEAKAAKRRGIRLYTQANAGGRTWDFGCLTYEPFPGQWMNRYEQMRRCHEEYGLVGVMECHHYGFWPSMITAMEKRAFEQIHEPSDAIIREVVDTFSGGQTEDCMEALEYWSRAIRLYMPTDHEQYCAMRVGPAYPLHFQYFPRPPVQLLDHSAVIPNAFTMPYGEPNLLLYAEGKFTLHSIRIRTEICILNDIIALLRRGLKIFRSLSVKTAEIKRLINMGDYMVCCFVTDIHVKQMYLCRQRLSVAPTKTAAASIISKMRRIGQQEIGNAEKALGCVDADSSLGFEPVMGYAGDRAHIEWKIRQVRHMLDEELAQYEAGLSFPS